MRGKVCAMTTIHNKTVATRLGLSESGVSRLRSGNRYPSLALMQTIESVYGWPVQLQSDAMLTDTWNTAFDVILQAREKESNRKP